MVVSRAEPHLVALKSGTVEIQSYYLDLIFVEHSLILVQKGGKSYRTYNPHLSCQNEKICKNGFMRAECIFVLILRLFNIFPECA